MDTLYEPGRGARVVIVWAAHSTVGRAVAIHLADRGDCVLALHAPSAAAGVLARETAAGGIVITAPIEAGNAAAGRAAVARCQAAFGRVDSLVLLPTQAAPSPLRALSAEAIDEAVQDHLLGPVHCVRAALPALAESDDARIICVSSLAGRVGLPLFGVVSACHHALDGLFDALAGELAPDGVGVAVITPALAPAGALALSAAPVGPQQRYAPVASRVAAALDQLARAAPTAADIARAVCDALHAKRLRPHYVAQSGRATFAWSRRRRPERALAARLIRALGGHRRRRSGSAS